MQKRELEMAVSGLFWSLVTRITSVFLGQTFHSKEAEESETLGIISLVYSYVSG